jgi:outer membrane protein assembly factor BamB
VLGGGCAGTVRGVVFVDRNGDGIRQRGEPGVAGVTVALDHRAFTTTDAGGGYWFAPATPGTYVWVSVPDGFRPGPVYRQASDEVALALSPLTTRQLATPLAFVVAADTHATVASGPWDGGDLEDAILQALALPEPPRFFTIVGDVTQGNADAEFSRVERALSGVAVPWVPVPGNHDWYDGGATWRRRWGPDSYSFDVGYLHVVVWDTNLSTEDQLAFFRGELARVAPDRIVVALGHDSPDDKIGDQLAALGVDYLFTGHWHANRRVERAHMIEWGTQTMVMGTIDQSPAGYRIVTFVDGVPVVEHRARLVEPHLAITSPHAGSCASPAGFDLLVSASLDAAQPAVTARIDCGAPIALAARGGWTFGAPLALSAGPHSVEVTATTPGGRTLTRRAAFEVCPRGDAVRQVAAWPQHGGGPRHENATAHAIAPPLQQLWATAVGGNVVLGTPVIERGVVVVTLWDLGAGDRGGVVALDLATGVERWRYRTPLPVRAAPAIAPAPDGELVVIALATGELHAVSLADGALRWTHDAAHGLDSRTSSLWGSPTIADGIVYVAVQGRMSAIAALDGRVVWERDLATPPYAWLGSLAAVTVTDGAAIANYDRANGMTSWNPVSGARQWHMSGGETVAVNATPVAHDGRLYVANAAGAVMAIDVATSARRWTTTVAPGSDDWTYAVTATPAVAGGRLFVPTQHRDLVALDLASGAELWRASTPGGPLAFAHYRAAEPGFAASAVVTGDILWVPRPDGVLAAHAVDDGRVLWSTQLGAPVVSAPAPAGDYLVVATFDGTVRALVPAAEAVAAPPVTCAPEREAPPAGCCSSGGSPSPPLIAWAAWWLVRRRREVRRRAARRRSRAAGPRPAPPRPPRRRRWAIRDRRSARIPR